MNLQIDLERLTAARDAVRGELLAERTVNGHWVGQPSGSPLATATAISALVVAHGHQTDIDSSQATLHAADQEVYTCLQSDLSELLIESLHWLAQRQNHDGGWGDTEQGRSNLAATMATRAALRLTCVPAKYEGLTDRADGYIAAQGGYVGLKKQHGRDKSISAPVLANCALAGLVPWRHVPALPFELACAPQSWQSRLRLPVASYAIPTLVAVGQLKFRHDRPRNPITRALRVAACRKSLAVVERLQPASGGIMESTPLTAFVVMGLAGAGLIDHPVVARGIEFLLASVRSDASWPIVSNLSLWNTALAMDALADKPPWPPRPVSVTHRPAAAASDSWNITPKADSGEVDPHARPQIDRPAATIEDSTLRLDENCLDWVLNAQHREPPTGSGESPGGWSWTEIAGGLANSDDTAAALIALAAWRPRYRPLKQHRLVLAAHRGIEWLLGMQNHDGGWPTFQREWHALPLDRSAADVTAHAVRALSLWQRQWQAQPPPQEAGMRSASGLGTHLDVAISGGLRFLEQVQRNDGSFVPHWFGNQHHPEGHNLVYGTAQVVSMCAERGMLESDMAQRAARWLLGVQHVGGGWGPPRSSPATSLSNVYRSNTSRAEDALASFCSVEETALALEALMPLVGTNQLYTRAVQNGLRWLVDAVEQGRLRQPAPIGFYFARLWYYERLYPLVFAAGALSRTVEHLAPQRAVVAAVG